MALKVDETATAKSGWIPEKRRHVEDLSQEVLAVPGSEVRFEKPDTKTEPAHYKMSKIAAIDVIEDWDLGFHAGNVIKYFARAGYKEGVTALDDLKKARWYLDRLIQTAEGKV